MSPTTPRLWILFPSICYVGLFVGLYVLDSVWAAILLYHAGIIAGLILMRSRGLGTALRSGWRGEVLWITCLVGAAGGGFVYELWPIVKLDGLVLRDALARLGLAGKAWWAFVAYFVTIHPVLEELFWREALVHRVSGGRDDPPGSGLRRPTWLDALFAGYHVLVLSLFLQPVWVVVSFVVLLTVGWLWRLAAVRWRGLGVPVLSHAVADASIMGAVVALTRFN